MKINSTWGFSGILIFCALLVPTIYQNLYAQNVNPIVNYVCSDQDLLAESPGNSGLNNIFTGCSSQALSPNLSFYLVQVQSGTTFTFLVTPENNIDFDFASWKNPDLTNLGPADRGSQNDPNQTNVFNIGLDLNSTELCEGPGASGNPDPGLVRYYDVVPGDQILIAIDRWSGTQSGFILSFGGDAVLNCTFEGDDYFECDNDMNGSEAFDLTSIGTDIADGDPNMQFSYYNNQADAESDATTTLNTPHTIFTSDNPTEAYVRVENQNGDLVRVEHVYLYLNNAPTINPLPDIEVCDDTILDGITTTDISINEALLTSDLSNLAISYYTSQTNANNATNPIVNPSIFTNNTSPYDQQVYVRVENSDGCFSTTSFHIIINNLTINTPDDIAQCDDTTLNDGYETFDLTSQIPDILGNLDPNNYTIKFFETQSQAENGTNEINTPQAYTNDNINLQNIFVRVTDNTTGCANIASFSLIVIPVPENLSATPLYACDWDGDGYTTFMLNEKNSEILGNLSGFNVFYYESMADLQAGINTLPSNYTNTSTPSQTLYVLVQNVTHGCYGTTTLELRVADIPVANNPAPISICDPDNDGYGFFDIESIKNEVTPNDGINYNITIHETQTDAENGINEFYSMYENILPDTQTMYVRVENSESHCYDVVPLQLIVNPTPIVPTTLDDLEICDDNVADGYAEFDLSFQNASVYGSQSTADFTITYHASLTAAEDGVQDLPFFYTNIYAFQQTIYVRLENNTTGCYTTREFDLIVHPNPVIAVDYDNTLELCDDFGEPGDELLIFDLTVENDEVTGDVNGYAVSYYHTSADAQSGNNQIINDTAYQNTVNPETLYVRVEDVNTGCTSFTTVTLRVLNNPTPLADIEPQETCDDDTDGDENNGQAVFDLTIDELAILNGEGGVTPVYYETYEDAFDGVNAIADPTAYYNITPYLQTIYIRVTNDVTGCYTITTFDLIVHPLPAVTDAPVYYLCEYDNDYVETFPLTDMDSFVMDGGDTTDLEITYYNTLADAEDDTAELVGPNITVNETRAIFARVYDEIHGCVQTVAYTIEIRQAPLANKPEPVALCDVEHELADGTIVPINDGIEIFDLTAVIDEIRGVQDPGTYEVSLYTSASDALDGINALEADEIVAYETTTTTLYALVTNVNTGCTNGDPIAVELYVEPLGEVVLTQTGSEVLCIDVTNNPIIGTDLGAGYSYLWNTGATTATIEITEGGEYFVEVINTNTINQCSYTSNTVVYQEASLPGVTPRVIQSEAFQGEDTIAVIAEGAGVSEYSYTLETGESNTTGIFTNVAPGFHTITITELNGCGSLAIQVSVIDYMRYFTPNGDGVNDKWRIIGLESQENAQVYIFDRQGKLIKQIAATSEGWNGTFNGTIMPSNDYWFKVVYTEPTTGEVKEYTSHFTLKR